MPHTIKTKVRGVTFDDRQAVIEKHCFEGDELLIAQEPDNPADPRALAVYVVYKSFFGRLKTEHIGYLSADLASEPEVQEAVADGSIAAEILLVTGGGDRSYGVNIQLLLPRQND